MGPPLPSGFGALDKLARFVPSEHIWICSRQDHLAGQDRASIVLGCLPVTLVSRGEPRIRQSGRMRNNCANFLYTSHNNCDNRMIIDISPPVTEVPHPYPIRSVLAGSLVMDPSRRRLPQRLSPSVATELQWGRRVPHVGRWDSHASSESKSVRGREIRSLSRPLGR